jgi:uncharacterized protein YutE (UPF0331/DUF86 family)
LADLRKHLAHLYDLKPRIESARSLTADLTLHNDVMFSLLMVCQLVIDISAELSSRKQLPYDDYTEAVRNLRKVGGFRDEVVAALEKLPGFRNVLMHDYVRFDLDRAVSAIRSLEAVDEFARQVADIEAS